VHLEAVKKHLSDTVFPEILNDWELDEQASTIAALPCALQEEVLRLHRMIWPVSHGLCSLFVQELPRILRCLTPEQLAPFAMRLLDAYEEGGLFAARRFLGDIDSHFLCALKGESGLSFARAAQRLTPYLAGLAGTTRMELLAGEHAATDTASITLPREIHAATKEEENLLLYKFVLTFQWAVATQGTYPRALEDTTWQEILGHRETSPLFVDLFLVAETYRLLGFLGREFPGLLKDATPLLAQIAAGRAPAISNPASQAVEFLKLASILEEVPETRLVPEPVRGKLLSLFKPLAGEESSPAASRMAAKHALELVSSLEGPYQPTPPLFFQGILDPVKVQAARRRQRQERKDSFIDTLAAAMPQGVSPEGSNGEEEGEDRRPASSSQGDATISPAGDREASASHPTYSYDPERGVMTVNGQEFEVTDELARLIKEIREDLGEIPPEYIMSALGKSGRRSLARAGVLAAATPEETEETRQGIRYDEWDFRRNGYRKEWCVLHLREIEPVRGSFYTTTLRRHQGLLHRLRRQFEHMRFDQRLARRQPEGDELDLDALVEHIADKKAGQTPDENLFLRLNREERNIAVIFLVDMSSSTEGWVNTAIKESLILMCESLSVLEDAYGIYGFSGMRRLRSDLFRIKDMDEPYSDTVKGKIAAISPQEYTRMGPPIRHASRLLAERDARIRLLITLSDGKPEDYDDYKGTYAVEDTRRALIEAKAMGIHPFCITIDTRAQEYIAHMYGEVNYIFIDDVRKLPARMPEVYRTLTT